MIVLAEGCGVQPAEWHVCERESAGYSRVYYITGGNIVYEDIQQRTALETGHLYVFPSCAPFELTHDPASPLCCLWYHFDLFPAMIDRMLDFPAEGALRCVLTALTEEQNAGRNSGDFYLALVKSLECYILEHGNISEPDESIAEIIGLIRATYFRRDFSVKKISDRFNYSTEHFIRRFRQYMNITPYQYVTNLRMAEAVRLLLEGKAVSVIAEEIGYSESKVFARAFTSHYGVSPSKYRSFYHPIA